MWGLQLKDNLPPGLADGHVWADTVAGQVLEDHASYLSRRAINLGRIEVSERNVSCLSSETHRQRETNAKPRPMQALFSF